MARSSADQLSCNFDMAYAAGEAFHDEQGVTAFDWSKVVEALGLSADC